MPLHVSSTCAHHQEVKITLHGLWYQFWPPDDKYICSKHVEAWNKIILKQNSFASNWLITEINAPIVSYLFYSTKNMPSLIPSYFVFRDQFIITATGQLQRCFLKFQHYLLKYTVRVGLTYIRTLPLLSY